MVTAFQQTASAINGTQAMSRFRVLQARHIPLKEVFMEKLSQSL